MTSPAERQQLLDVVEEARQAGARYRKCASVIGLTVRTMERWRRAVAGDGRKAAAALRGSKSKLTPSEHNEILRRLILLIYPTSRGCNS